MMMVLNRREGRKGDMEFSISRLSSVERGKGKR